MAAKPFQITMEEFNFFHNNDRNLYSILVKELQRDPFESMRILALWIWLERIGLNDLIRKILSLHYFLINKLADEAATCLKCIEENQFLLSANANEIPLTQSLIAKEFSLLFFHQNRDSVTNGIRNIAIEVCLKAFPEWKALNRRSEQTLTKSEMEIVSPPDESSLLEGIAQLGLESDISPRRMKGHNVQHEERTMIVTFSKDYSIVEWEIRKFFTTIFGECIEYILMEEVKSHEHALYARIVFVTPGIIEFILNDEPKVRFNINGKHMWMQNFIPKNRNSSFPKMLPQNLSETI